MSGVPAGENTVLHTPPSHIATTHSFGVAGQSFGVVHAGPPLDELELPPPAPLLDDVDVPFLAAARGEEEHGDRDR